MLNDLLDAEQRHQLERLESGLFKIHEATTRFNSMLADFDPKLRLLPEFFLHSVSIDLVEVRRANERAQDAERAGRLAA